MFYVILCFDLVIGIENEKALRKIHENFRIVFFKDLILNRILEEIAYGILSDIEQLNYAEIINYLHEDSSFPGKLFQKIRSSDRNERRQGLKFLRELFFHVNSLEVIIYLIQ